MTDPQMLTDARRPAIRVERRYDHPIERVWQAVTTPQSLAQWFPAEAEFELRQGGQATFGGDSTGEVLRVDPPRRLFFTWDGDTFEFALRELDGGTLFTLTHGFDDRAGAASFATGWEACMAGLRDVLAGDEPAPPAADRNAGRHEALASRFGLDEPVIERSDTGWTARFERQLTCPAQSAWDLFFGTDPDTGEQLRAPAVGQEFRPAKAEQVVLGTATEVDEPRSFAFTVAADEPGDTVRLRFGEGTGHGARLFLEVRGTDTGELEAAIDQWGAGAVAHLAREAARLASHVD